MKMPLGFTILMAALFLSCGITNPDSFKLVNDSDYTVTVEVSKDYDKNNSGAIIFGSETVNAHAQRDIQTNTSSLTIKSYNPADKVEMRIDNPGRQVVFTNRPPERPTIIVDPENKTIFEGQSASFSVNVTGTLPINYIWQKNGTTISGESLSVYITPAMNLSDSGSSFRCIARNAAGEDTSNAAVLIVNRKVKPTVTHHPENVTISIDKAATFAVSATGTKPFSYQWQKNGIDIPLATDSFYITQSVTTIDSGSTYRCILSNSSGIDTSESAMLKVSKIVDIDGNAYTSILIGTQTWMVENLKTTKYNDGTPIPSLEAGAPNGLTNSLTVSSSAQFTSPFFCWYDRDSLYKNVYGGLYNWYTINTGKLAPMGWHVPTDSEWNILIQYLGGDSIVGGKLKEIGTNHWLLPNSGATNESSFSALPGGYLLYDDPHNCSFNSLYSYAGWWSSSDHEQPNRFFILNNLSNILSNTAYKAFCHSIRCIKD